MNPALRTHRRTGARSRLLTALALGLAVVVSTLAGVPGTGVQPAEAVISPRLSVSPANYVGGQRVTWTGNVGRTGVRSLVLQFNMGNVTGNNWETVAGFTARTRSDGSFSFVHPAPSMFNIAYRVKAGDHVTPSRTFNAKTQDLTLRLTGEPESRTNAPARVAVGQLFGLTVDTTPETIFRSPSSRGLPVLSGRTLTLQKRITSRRWDTIATTRVGLTGLAWFPGLRESAGTAVYRVRAENYFANGNRIGWTQSFPLHVLVGPEAQQLYTSRYGLNEPSSDQPPSSNELGRQPGTASQRYSWFPSVFDFAWEYGESLSSAPARGTRIAGHWRDFSDGSGRVSKHNGGLAIDSKRYAGAGAGDFGTTGATLHGNALTYGRWETSLRIRNAFESSGRPYQVLAELVPARSAQRACAARTITIASISPFSKRVRFGVRSRRHQWSGTASAAYTPLANAYNVAVEVTPRHITWFLNNAPVASVTNTAAVPGVPMTLRLSLQGRGHAEMDQTGLVSDWQRGFPVRTGKQTVAKRKLSQKAATAACK